MSFTFLFIIVEGAFSTMTNWGIYSQGTQLLWGTPLYLIPIWLLISSGVGYLNCFLQDVLKISLVTNMLLIGGCLFFAALAGEAIGSYISLWQFNSHRFSWFGVPLWVPISYSLAFLFSPLLINNKFGGAAQALLIGIFWQISRLLM